VGYRKESLIKNLTEKKDAKVVKVELNVLGDGNFVRAKVRLDVRKPLARFVSMSRGGACEVYPIKFEKMPRFCGAFGYIGHSYLECGTGEHDEEKLKWGEFLKADWGTWHGRSFNGGRGGARTGRGAWEPRGERDRAPGRGGEGTMEGRFGPHAWRHNALAFIDGIAQPPAKGNNTDMRTEEIDDDDLKDTGTSPIKTNKMEVDNPSRSGDSGAKRNLTLALQGQENANDTLEEGDVLQQTGTVSLADQEVLDAKLLAENDRKRSKKDGAISPSTGSAGSRDGPVRT
jgi:hypothetical protein